MAVSYTHLDVYKRQVVSRESVDEVMKVCVERLDWRRASFPQVYVETEVSQMLYEDRVSSSSCVEDKLSLIHISCILHFILLITGSTKSSPLWCNCF